MFCLPTLKKNWILPPLEHRPLAAMTSSFESSYELSFSRMTILLFLDAISMHLDGENVNGSLPKERVGEEITVGGSRFSELVTDGPILFYTREISARINRLIKRS